MPNVEFLLRLLIGRGHHEDTTSGLGLGDVLDPEKCLFLAMFLLCSQQTGFSIDLVGHVGTGIYGLYLLGGCRTMDSHRRNLLRTNVLFCQWGEDPH